ncbi:MAG: hypothetical protein QNJ62_11885, partial [Methyloceanibacter sp.]|nr:hypothetical protein [Methyloceanibacter sp.]
LLSRVDIGKCLPSGVEHFVTPGICSTRQAAVKRRDITGSPLNFPLRRLTLADKRSPDAGAPGLWRVTR